MVEFTAERSVSGWEVWHGGRLVWRKEGHYASVAAAAVQLARHLNDEDCQWAPSITRFITGV